MKPIGLIIIVLAIIVVIIGIVLVVMSSSSETATEVATSPVPTATATPTSTTTATPADDASEVDEIILIDVTEGGTSSGTATRQYVDGTFTHQVTATLPDLPEGEFYEGWLVKADNSEFFSTGKMTKSGDEYTLTYTSATNHEDYPLVVITRETVDDETPEEHILEGNLTEMLLL